MNLEAAGPVPAIVDSWWCIAYIGSRPPAVAAHAAKLRGACTSGWIMSSDARDRRDGAAGQQLVLGREVYV